MDEMHFEYRFINPFNQVARCRDNYFQIVQTQIRRLLEEPFGQGLDYLKM